MPPRGRYNGRRGTVRVSEDALSAGLLARRLLLEPGNPYKFKTVDPDDRTQPVFGPRQTVIDKGKQDQMYSKFMTHSVDMGRFCTLVGDHASGMLYDRANCPSNPWPTQPETVLAMMKYKCSPFGTPLQYYGRDVFDPSTGEQVFCTGKWKCPTNLDAFKGMFKCYSMKFQNDLFDKGSYSSACFNCQSSPDGYCEKHEKVPRLFPTGDITEELNVKAEFKRLHKELTDKHTRRGNYAITPNEMRKLRTHLLSSRNKENYKLYVMLLFGTKFFLRVNEMLSMKVEDFCSKMFQVNADGVRTLSVYVQGKCDAKKVLLNAYSDLEGDTEMDLVMHLMVYMKSEGITSGLLFPGRDSATEIPYETFLKQVKHLLINVLDKKEKEICVGTHTLRKTGYLFGVYSMLYAFAKERTEKSGK
jgi:hypothetical protein